MDTRLYRFLKKAVTLLFFMSTLPARANDAQFLYLMEKTKSNPTYAQITIEPDSKSVKVETWLKGKLSGSTVFEKMKDQTWIGTTTNEFIKSFKSEAKVAFNHQKIDHLSLVFFANRNLQCEFLLQLKFQGATATWKCPEAAGSPAKIETKNFVFIGREQFQQEHLK